MSGRSTVPVGAKGNLTVITISSAWLAAAVQLLGTIFFNISTGEALDVRSVEGQREFVWGPDVDGSTAFLISSLLALVPLLRKGVYWSPSDREWTSTWLNLLGSIAFGVSAIASIVQPGGGVKDATAASIGTFAGVVCFLLAAALLLRDPSDDVG